VSKDLNNVQLTGRLGADPDITIGDDGTPRTTFRMAVNRRWKDANGQQQSEADWFSVTAWDRLAEVAGEYLHKGSHIYAEGRLKTSTWTDDVGTQHYRTDVVLHELIMFDPPRQPADDADAAPEQAKTAAPDPVPAPATRRRARLTDAQRAAADDLL